VSFPDQFKPVALCIVPKDASPLLLQCHFFDRCSHTLAKTFSSPPQFTPFFTHKAPFAPAQSSTPFPIRTPSFFLSRSRFFPAFHQKTTQPQRNVSMFQPELFNTRKSCNYNPSPHPIIMSLAQTTIHSFALINRRGSSTPTMINLGVRRFTFSQKENWTSPPSATFFPPSISQGTTTPPPFLPSFYRSYAPPVILPPSYSVRIPCEHLSFLLLSSPSARF